MSKIAGAGCAQACRFVPLCLVRSFMKNLGSACVCFAGFIALIGVLVHVAAIIGGVPWYVFFGAPPVVVQSARDGTLLAPLSTALIASLMALCSAYAFSALGMIRRLPVPRLMLGGMAGVCLLRALILVPLSIDHPELRNAFEVVAAIVWGIAGVGFVQGFRLVAAAHAARAPHNAG